MYFIVTCFKVSKIICAKIGLFATIIFVFGILSFFVLSNNNNVDGESNIYPTKTWKLVTNDSFTSYKYSLIIDLENTLISKYQLRIQYCKDKEGQTLIPVEAFTSTTGLSFGTHWKPISVRINATNDKNKLEYIVYGVVEWKLINTPIMYQGKIYKGFAFTKDTIIRRE